MTKAGKTGAIAAALMVLAGTYCSAPAEDAVPGDAEESAEMATPAASLSDAEIAAIVVAANSIDVGYGEIARARATDERVRQFAETMIRDHTAVNESAGELVSRLGLTPQPSDVSRSLEAAAADTREVLLNATGAEFDRAYVANEVAFHRTVLEALDSLLIPNAANAELKETLVGVRPAFEGHLRHAESLQQSLGM